MSAFAVHIDYRVVVTVMVTVTVTVTDCFGGAAAMSAFAVHID